MKARELLSAFGFPEPERILRAYPHELSGGMQQRVLCAAGAACSPRWILADEPTKGLDRDLRSQVRETLLSLREHGVKSMLVITHDLPLAVPCAIPWLSCMQGRFWSLAPVFWKSPASLYPVLSGCFAGKRLSEYAWCGSKGRRTSSGLSICSKVSDSGPRCHQERPPACSPEPGKTVRCFQYV